MSASSQATGHNCLDITIAPTTSVTLAGWVKVNAFDKVAFDSICEVGTSSGATYKAMGLQQDPDGTGAADLFRFYWFNALGGGGASSPDAITATGVWKFLVLTQSGTTINFWIGNETGSLTNISTFTADFSASAYTYVRLASDHAGTPEDFNGSFRGWRLWVDHVPSNLTAERDSSTFAAVDATGLVSALPLANGTSPGTASAGTNWTLTGTFADDASNPSFATTPINRGFLPAQLQASQALPQGFVAMANFGAGLRLGSPAIQLFQPSKLPAQVPPSTPPLLARRRIEEFNLDTAQRRVTQARPAPVVSSPALSQRRFTEDVMIDVRTGRAVLPPQPAPGVAPLWNPDRVERGSVDEERATRSRAVPSAAPIANIVPPPRRARDEASNDEDAARPRPVPLPLQSDVSPLQNRRATEQTIPDEAAQRTRPPVAPSVDFSPLPSRRALEQTTPDEVAVRFRQQPPASVDFAPVVGRRARDETVPDEEAERGRPVPLPLTSDVAPLRGRLAVEQIATDEIQRRGILVPAAPLAAPAPSIPRRVLEWLGVDEWPRPRRAVPTAATPDVAPLRGRGLFDQAPTEEPPGARAKVVPASVVVPTAYVAPPRRVTEELSPNESMARGRVAPPPLVPDIAPLRGRGSFEQPQTEDQASARVKLVPVSSVAVVPNVANQRRAVEEPSASETAVRARSFPQPAPDVAPLRIRSTREEGANDEAAPRPRPVLLAPVAMVLRVARRIEEVFVDESAKRSGPTQALPPDIAPILGRRSREDGSAPDELASRGRPTQPAPLVSTPPLTARRATEETVFETTWRRLLTFIGFPSAPDATFRAASRPGRKIAGGSYQPRRRRV